MVNTNELEARAKAAAESLASRQEYQKTLNQDFRILETEIEELRGDNQRLETDFAAVSVEKVRIVDEAQRLSSEAKALREEKQQLTSDNKRVQEEVERLESEAEGLRKDCERLNVLLEALIVQIELNVDGQSAKDGNGDTAEAEVTAIGGGEPTNLNTPVNDDDTGTDNVVSAMRDKYVKKDDIADVPDDRAKRLLGSIRDRL